MELQLVELHFSKSPRYEYVAIKARAEEILGEELEAPDPSKAKDAYLLFHKNHPIQCKDAQVPAQTAILAAHQPIDIAAYSGDIQQSWGFRDCASILSQSRHTLLVTEMMARLLPPGDRVHLFHGVLQAVIEVTQPDALVFKHSQQVVRPEAYLGATSKAPILRPGSLNVRFFNIANTDGDMLMDTRGLCEVGLPDLQCHFRNLKPGEVSGVLYNTAVYIFENGAIIESGNAIAGVGSNSKWECQFEDSLIAPQRDVLDLNPGFPNAAGSRN